MKAYIVDRALLRKNIAVLLKEAGEAAFYGVVKGNGYGLGLEELSEVLWEEGVRRFAVAEPSEATRLRQAGLYEAEILMLRETCLEQELSELMDAGAVIPVGSLESARLVDRMAQDRGIRQSVHVKIDTGMGRYGFLPEETEEAAQVYSLPHLHPTGIFTHFHSAFFNEKATRDQFAAFQKVIETLQGKGIDVGLRHCCNSSAFLKYPEMRLDGVRVGSALLGRLSFGGDYGLSPVGWCEAQVEVVRQIPAGHSVGYRADWTAKRDTRIAVFSVGHAQGFDVPTRYDPISFGEWVRSVLATLKTLLRPRTVYVEIGGKKAPVVGNIGMVQAICDVTDIPCSVGDTVRVDLKPLAYKNLPIQYRN